MANLIMPDLDQAVHMPDMSRLATSGIYFLMLDGVVVYVGQARDMRRRVSDHIAEGVKTFDTIAYVPCRVDRLNEVERGYIEKLMPKYNRCALSASFRDHGAEPNARGQLVGVERTVRVGPSRLRKTITVLA